MTNIFETRITSIGPEAQHMIGDAGMFILFGEGAPEDLAEFCFTINSKEVRGDIRVGGEMAIDGTAYPITAVGHLVQKNLSQLGHITVALDGSDQGSLPGTLHIAAVSPPTLSEGTLIQIFE